MHFAVAMVKNHIRGEAEAMRQYARLGNHRMVEIHRQRRNLAISILADLL